jgi:hypothetical protein
MSAPEDCLDWSTQRADFERDGSLRDIYVLDTSLEDWDRVLDLVTREAPGARLVHAETGALARLDSRDVGALFREEQPYRLVFSVGGVELCCHFFSKREVEFDFSPDGLDEMKMRGLLRFMARLGEVTGKRVVLTPENVPALPIYVYDPATGRVSWGAP